MVTDRVRSRSVTQKQAVLAVAVAVVVIAGAMFAIVAHPWARESATEAATKALQAHITANEQMWQQSGIANYRITVRESRSTLAPVAYTVVLTVQGGRVVARQLTDCRFGGTPCNSGYPATDELDGYTVPGLFSYAHGLATGEEMLPSITFDPKYGFPSTH